MLFPSDIEDKIDFSVIRRLLRDRCSFAVSREEADALSFLTDFDVLQDLLSETWEMLCVRRDASLAMPRVEMCDIRESLSRIRVEGLFLDEAEVVSLGKVVDAVSHLEQFFSSLPQERFRLLPHYAAMSPDEPLPCADIRRAIDAILDKYGSVRDDASPEMLRIRRELRLSQGAAERALASVMRHLQGEGVISSDLAPTLREGRLVIPLPPAYKRKVGGIVHDESATGKTVYVEPQQVVDANNRIRELEGEESRERVKILQHFADYVRPYSDLLKQAQQWLGHIDFIIAKAHLADDLNAIAPQMHNQPMIDLREARHPLLYLSFKEQQRELVPLTVKLTEDSRVLIISGPNAGGKSVCLKTIALLQYMLQCGLLVPLREDSQCGVFESMFIDIGDDQSLDDDLSTYSSHLRNMKAFLKSANEDSIYFIDEFGGGTEPLLGGAIAEAVLNGLCKSKAFGVVTTHYTNLKHFADTHAEVNNGAMLYDRQAMRPLFQLSIGQPGSSFAIEIAEQIGLPKDVILDAKQLIGDDNIQYERNLQEIARDKRYWADKRREVHDKEKQLDAIKERYESEMADIRKTRKEIISKAKEDAADILQKSNRTIENTIRQIKESQADRESTRQARQRVENMRQQMSLQGNTNGNTNAKQGRQVIASADGIRVVSESSYPPNLSPTRPRVSAEQKTNNKPQNEVLRTTASGRKVFNDFSQLSVLTERNDDNIPQQKQSAPRVNIAVNGNIADSIRKRKLSFSQEIDLRGYYADEALQEVMSYIDDAIMVGAEEVRILHGTGGGVLKQVIRDYLRPLKHVEAVRDGDPDKGGAGITVVYLK